MKQILILTLAIIALFMRADAQSRDTTYLQEIGENLFKVAEKVHADGSASMERTPVTDTAMVFKYWTEKMERTGINHAKSVAQMMNAGPLISQAEDLNPLGKDPLLYLSSLVCERLAGSWLYNNDKASISGQTLTVVGRKRTIRAMCMQWIVLTDSDNKNNHFYLVGEGKYQSLCGDTLEKTK